MGIDSTELQGPIKHRKDAITQLLIISHFVAISLQQTNVEPETSRGRAVPRYSFGHSKERQVISRQHS